MRAVVHCVNAFSWLTRKQHDDPTSWTEQPLIPQFFTVLQEDTTDSERCWFDTRRSTSDEGSPREQASQARLKQGHRETETRSPDQLRLWTGHDGASRLVSKLLSLRCLSISPTRETVSMIRRSAKAERILAVADNATRMRVGLQSKTFEPTEG